MRRQPRIGEAAALLAAMVTVGCFPRGVDVPVAYSVRANADNRSLPCAKERLTDLGFRFDPEYERDDGAVATRVTRRGSRVPLQELLRLNLVGEDDRPVLLLELGVNRGRAVFDPKGKLFNLANLGAPSRHSIDEVDEVMARCQRSPL